MSDPVPTGSRSQNPYCKCGKHLGVAFHESDEHDEARDRGELHAAFNAITRDTDGEVSA